eukprot:TRINITY_DN2098_c0_g1_i17.p1 TRINITY_DN2098_c0_g1~~TRINITY_DN2098_c0_g1_i17.p1  ORF type:complete len:198 (+),score=21.93 TRINITY_DN2098_c0_g1_i17:526-1119(+)
MSDETRIQVAVRIRPRLETQGERYDVNCCRKADSATVHLSKPDDENWAVTHKCTFSFDYAFDEEDSQIDVYSVAVQPLVDSLLGGGHSTIFTYGQTGSGKTYTLLGKAEDSITTETGVFLRTVADILKYAQSNVGGLHVVVTLSVLEIYNEEIRDLLNNKNLLQPRIFCNSSHHISLLVSLIADECVQLLGCASHPT